MPWSRMYGIGAFFIYEGSSGGLQICNLPEQTIKTSVS